MNMLSLSKNEIILFVTVLRTHFFCVSVFLIMYLKFSFILGKQGIMLKTVLVSVQHFSSLSQGISKSNNILSGVQNISDTHYIVTHFPLFRYISLV